jgi:hypothetical protein
MELVSAAGTGPDASGDQAYAGTAETAQVTWCKSSWSTYNGNCVEVARLTGGLVGVRDTKDRGSGPVLVFESDSWRSFLDAVKGEFSYR